MNRTKIIKKYGNFEDIQKDINIFNENIENSGFEVSVKNNSDTFKDANCSFKTVSEKNDTFRGH